MLRRATLSAWGAWARGDIDLTLVRLAPDFHIELQPEWVAAGMRSSYEGYVSVRERAADQHEVWQRMEFIPQELGDAGDVLVALGSYHVRARGSGIEFNFPIGSLLRLERGLIVREHDSAPGRRRFVSHHSWSKSTQARGALLFHVRGGKVTRLVLYFDRERALADLGLASEARSSRS